MCRVGHMAETAMTAASQENIHLSGACPLTKVAYCGFF